MKKGFYFLIICLTALGIIGGIGYTIYQGAYAISVGVAVTGYMAWPQVKDYFKKLTE